jgi:hypothetical protein
MGTDPLNSSSPTSDDSAAGVEAEWIRPDPPPIPDRIRKEVEPRRVSLAALPKPKLNDFTARRLMLGGGVLLLGLIIFLFTRGGPFDGPAQRRWQALCNDYGQWFAAYSQRLTPADKVAFDEAGLGDALIDPAIARRYDPRVIAYRPDANLQNLRDDPPDAARDQQAVEATRRASVGIARIEGAFRAWPVFAGLEDHYRFLRDAGYAPLAEQVRRVLHEAPPYGPHAPGPAVAEMTQLHQQTTLIVELIREMEADLAVLPADDPVMAALRERVRRVRETDPRAWPDAPRTSADRLAEQLQPLHAFARRMRGVVEGETWARVSTQTFRESGEAYRLLDDGSAELDRVLRAWLDEVDQFVQVDEDWRDAWAELQRATLDDIGRRLGGVEGAQRLRDRVEGLESRLEALLRQPLVAGTAADLEIERATLEREVRELRAAAARVEQERAGRDAARQLRGQASPLGRPGFGSAVLDRHWRTERQRLADGVEQGEGLDTTARELGQLERQLLRLIDPNRPNALPPAEVVSIRDGDAELRALWVALNRAVEAARERTLAEAVRGPLPVPEPAWTVLRQDYLEHMHQAAAMAEAARRARQLLEGLHRLDDPDFRRAGRDLSQTLAAWDRSPLWQSQEVAEAGEPLRQRMAGLAAIEALADRDLLRGLASDADDPAYALAAWRRLNALPLPARADPLAEASELAAGIRPRIEAVADAGRRQQLRDELAAAGRQRWVQAMERAGSVAALERVAASAEAWGIDPATLPERPRVNLLLFDLKRDLDVPGLEDQQILARAQAFLEATTGLARAPGVASWRSELQSLTAYGNAARELLAEAGPAQRGWRLQLGGDPQTVRYTRDGLTLTFTRIQSTEGPAFYLGQDEVTRRVAAAALGPADEWVRRWPAATAEQPDDLPATDLSPAAAVALADRLGCRLPTVAQWEQADEEHPVPAGILPNLRDPSTPADAPADRRRVFDPDGWLTADPAAATYPLDDGADGLLPIGAEADPGPRPRHLIGNAAEWVTTSASIDTSILLDQTLTLPQRLEQFQREHAGAFAVVGGSAYAPRQLDPQEPRPVDPAAAAEGFGDVGLRLVFVPERVYPARQVQQIVRQQAYLGVAATSLSSPQ